MVNFMRISFLFFGLFFVSAAIAQTNTSQAIKQVSEGSDSDVDSTQVGVEFSGPINYWIVNDKPVSYEEFRLHKLAEERKRKQKLQERENSTSPKN